MSSETKPFLTYHSDDDASSMSSLPRQQTNKQKLLHAVQSNIVPYSIVFAVTTFLWMVVVFTFIPDASSSSLNHKMDKPNARKHNMTSGMHLLTCGDSRSNDEARSMGCKYDILLNGWVPEPCYDEEFITEYTDDLSSTSYLYPNLTHPLNTIEEMVAPGHYYTSMRDHVNHCATMWKKQFWVMFEERSAMDSFISSPGHTDHCAQFLMDAGSGDLKFGGSTKVDVGFAGCWVRD